MSAHAFDYIVVKVNYGLTSCDDLATSLNLIHYNRFGWCSCDQCRLAVLIQCQEHTYMWPDMGKRAYFTHPILYIWRSTKTRANSIQIWNFQRWQRNSSSTIPESFTSISYSKEILWVTKVEKLYVWTMHVFAKPVTYTVKDTSHDKLFWASGVLHLYLFIFL